MSKVDIFKDDEDRWHVEVDGINVAGALVAGGVRVDFDSGGMSPLVHLTLRPRELRLSLPEATVQAVEALLPGREV